MNKVAITKIQLLLVLSLAIGAIGANAAMALDLPLAIDTITESTSVNASAISSNKAGLTQLIEKVGTIEAVPGPAGADGAKGDTGAAGTNGIDGAKGDTGAAGIDGAKGDTGAAGIDGAPGQDGNGLSGTNDGDMQYWKGSEWILVKSPGYEATLRLCHNIPTWGACTYAIGDKGPAGGIVFYITDGGLHGFEASPTLLPFAAFGCQGNTPFTTRTLGWGAQNTKTLLEFDYTSCGLATTAAKLADEYQLNGYDDWFLPSLDELLEASKSLPDQYRFFDYKWSSTMYPTGTLPTTSAARLLVRSDRSAEDYGPQDVTSQYQSQAIRHF